MKNSIIPILKAAIVTTLAIPLLGQTADNTPSKVPNNAYFGAVHVHTRYSFDAFTNGALTGPAGAYKWAQGETLTDEAGPSITINTPLDFYAVSDHAEWMGVFKEMENPDSPLSKHPKAPAITSSDTNTAMQAFAQLLRDVSTGNGDPAFDDPAISTSVWSEIVKTADDYYRPGHFTTFPAFEWTANPNFRNMHRVVVFQNSTHLPDRVLSSFESEDPETLWAWMDNLRDNGATLLAIPHNANASDGMMFSLENFSGEPMGDAYIETRRRNEPLYEITQIKGTSETHPDLSPDDPFAGFEQWDYTLSADSKRPTNRRGSFARQALLDGIGVSAAGRANPFQYGFIGDSDTHNSAASNEEDNYSGKFAFENQAAHRLNGVKGQPPAQAQQVREFSSGGIAGVWAEENTREAIYAAMARRETFGTTGPHIRIRLFGGWDFADKDLASADFVTRGYDRGVPMGGSLAAAPADSAPTFMISASKDPKSGHLDRAQIVKGWVDAEGKQHEKVYDVAWSGDRKPDARGMVPAVGNTVDVKKANYTNAIGSAQLFAMWQDPSFDPSQHAFYYLRVLEIPTPRWSTRDAAKLGVPIPDGLAPTIQERAYSSPIWYSPTE